MERVKRRWWARLVTLAASLVITGALLSGLFQLAILGLPGYRRQIAEYVSQSAGRQVDIGGVSLVWRGLAPELELTDLTLYPESASSTPVSVGRLTLGFSLGRSLRGGLWMPSRIQVSGLRLVAVIDPRGEVRVRGFDTPEGVSAGRTDWLRDLERFERLAVEDSELTVVDERLAGATLKFWVIEAGARRTEDGAEFSAELRPPYSRAARLELNARLSGDLLSPATLSGDWEASVAGYSGSPWLGHKAPPDLALAITDAEAEMTGAIVGGRLGPSRVRLSAASVAVARGQRSAAARAITLDAALDPLADGWQVEIGRLALGGARGAWPDTSARARVRRGVEGGWRLDGDIDFVRIDDLLAFVLLADHPALRRLQGLSGDLRDVILRYAGPGMMPAAIAEWMPEAAPAGEAASPPGNTQPAHSYLLRARLDGLGLAAGEGSPGFRGLSGQIVATESAGGLTLADELASGGFELSFDPMFDSRIAFEALSGALVWTRRPDRWLIDMPDYRWAFAGSQGSGQMRLDVPDAVGASPSLSLAANFSSDDVTLLKPYIPKPIGEGLQRWLRRAVEAGEAPSARLEIDGPLASFPFSDGSGRFALDIDVRNGRLAYLQQWPAIEEASARLSFRGSSLSIQGESGVLAGSRLQRFDARIDDLRKSLLAVDGVLLGEAERLYDALAVSPLANRLSALLGQTQAQGKAQVNLHVSVPLSDAAAAEVDGEIVLAGNTLSYAGLAEPIENIRGTIRFFNDGLAAENLSATLAGLQVVARIEPLSGGVSRLEAQAPFTPDVGGAGLSRFIPDWIRTRLKGTTPVYADLELGGPSALLMLSTDLDGLAVDLPAPFAKPAGTARPFALALSGDAEVPLRLELAYDKDLEGELRFAYAGGQPVLTRGLLRLGGESSPAPTLAGLWIDGRTPSADIADWVGLFAKGGQGESPLGGLDLDVGSLWLAGQATAPLRLSLRPSVDGLDAALSGAGGEGTLRWQAGEGGHVEARLARLQLDPGKRPLKSTDTDTSVAIPGDAPTRPARGPIDPAGWPLLDLEVGQLKLGEADLGRIELRTARMDGGQRLETLTAGGAELDLNASGHWRRAEGRSDAHAEFKGTSRSIGELLSGFGYAPSLDARSTGFEAVLDWPAAPDIDWTQAQGRIRFDVADGALRAVEPGAGRVLGLMNFYALPRRLTLDFSDVVEQGLAFDRIEGEFKLAGGLARTEDLDIDAPSLSIRVRGDVDLAHRAYDQHVTVYPDVSGGVTLGALLLGGPAAGLVALIAQQVLDKPLDQITHFSYSVTGPWDNPEVKRARADTAQAGVRPAPELPDGRP